MRSNCCWDSHSTTRRESCKKGWISSAARTRACRPPLLLLLLLLWDVEGRGDDVIILESMQIRRPHENGRAAFSDFSTLRPVFKKVCLQDPCGRSAKTMQNVCFRKRALSSGRGLKITWPVCGFVVLWIWANFSLDSVSGLQTSLLYRAAATSQRKEN